MTISVSATTNIIIPPTTANTAAGTLPSSEVSSTSSVGVVVGVGTFRCMVETSQFAVDDPISSVSVVVGVGTIRVMIEIPPFTVDDSVSSMPVSVVVGLGAFGVMVETPPFTVDDSMSPIGVVVGVGMLRILMVWVFTTLVILPVGVSESVVEAVCKSKSNYNIMHRVSFLHIQLYSSVLRI